MYHFRKKRAGTARRRVGVARASLFQMNGKSGKYGKSL